MFQLKKHSALHNFLRHIKVNHGNSIYPRHQKFGATALTTFDSLSQLQQRNEEIKNVFKYYCTEITNSKSMPEAINYIREMRLQLSAFPSFGYVTVDNLVQLGSLCGYLPAVCYSFKELPNTKSSGSNRFISKMTAQYCSKTNSRKFEETVSLVQKCCSKRIFHSDIENVMCEIDRDDRNLRKVECIFYDKSIDMIQNFYRIFKTNISRYSSVLKFQVQILQHNKWVTLEKYIKPMFEIWELKGYDSSTKCGNGSGFINREGIVYNVPF